MCIMFSGGIEFALGGVLKSLGPCRALPGMVGAGIESGVTWPLFGLFGNGLLLTLPDPLPTLCLKSSDPATLSATGSGFGRVS